MGAVETENYVQAAGTFAGVDPPPAPIDASGIVGQQGFSSFIRNGVGDYTLGLELAIGFLEAEVRVQPGLNQLVVIGGQVDPDTERVQVRCYDSLGNPADCQIFSIQVLKIAVGPPGQLPIPPPPTPISAGASCGPDTFIDIDGNNNPTQLLYETQFNVANPLVGGENENTDMELPEILLADKGRCLWVYTCYLNDPGLTEFFGHGQIKAFDDGFGPDQIKLNGDNVVVLDLMVNDDALRLYHDGVDTWYLGN